MAAFSARPLPKNLSDTAGSLTNPCPACFGPTAVVDTRPTTVPVKATVRRRVCVECRHRFTTKEVPVSWLESARLDLPDLSVIETHLREALDFVQLVRNRG